MTFPPADRDPGALRFPPGFDFGVATSAHQVEGGTTANTWSAWELGRHPDGRPTIATGERCGRGADHWARFDADLGLMRWLGIGVYRFSVEWSRIEPLAGQLDLAALERYRQWCLDLRAAGITPMVTLHHFTEPLWTRERGGFEQQATVDAWVRFVQLCVRRLGDVVDRWVTINEPVAYVSQGWLRGEWPPGRRDPTAAAQVLENLLLAHARAYQVIHAADRGPRRHQVGLAHNIMPMRPQRAAHPGDRFVARQLDRTYNWAVPDALAGGVLRLRLPGLTFTARHPAVRGTQDFFGLNHYHRVLVRARPGAAEPVALLPLPGERSDLGWSLEPWTLGATARAAARYGLPIIVTEHGAADGDTPDVRRRHFLGGSLAALAAARRDGVDVRGYLHWSLLDNFEWAHGYSMRMGLFRVDRDDFRRITTSSARFYRDVIAAQAGGGDT